MKRVTGLFGIGVFVLACGGGGGGGSSHSFSELKSKIEQPTGDLSENNAKSVVAALKEEQEGSKGMGKLGLSSVQVAYEEPISCPTTVNPGQTSITCNCNAGGTVSFAVPGMTSPPKEGTPISVQYSYKNCSMTDGECTTTINGSGWVLYEYPNTQEYCFSFSGTVNSCGEGAESFSAEYCYLNGEVWYLVEVDGQYFAARGYFYDNGTFDIYVKDKDGEWHCYSNDGVTGTCEGPETFTFDLGGGNGDGSTDEELPPK